MRTNLPITQVEYVMKDGESIVSKTDLKGKITYINPYFIEVSGFDEEELIGAPHNLVRHPDMPPEAYADLWTTLKAGRPWTGMVKNRRKNGDYYWVKANVVPIRENGRVSGYMSVRTKPERADIDAAEEIYRKFRSNKAKGLKIEQGAVVRTGVTGKIAALADMALSRQIGGSMLMLLALFIAASMLPGAYGAAALVTGLAMICFTWFSLHRAMVAPLRQATDIVYALAGGDLQYQFTANGKGDMGQLLRGLGQMNVNLKSILRDVQINVEAIRVGTSEIAAGNLELSGRTESQAANLEETAASMEEFASTVKENAANAVQADKLAVSATQVAAKGGEVVAKVGATMKDISSSAGRIVEIISMIDGIAFQTNILALNAAVEAARAGDQGRGFAVVATEVRNLAQRSATAASEIKKLIGASVDSIKAGSILVDETGRTMNEIVGSVQQVMSIMEEITLATKEQSTGIDQVNQAVMQMDEVTQQNAAMVEEAASAAASLAEQTIRLAQAVSVFQIGAVAPAYAPNRAVPARAASAIAAPRPSAVKHLPSRTKHLLVA
ncbi:methyl-accepting chemotaxis protein [Undibacterium terreum]|uniref:Aerotaxis sensor receptor n=1 Tax=Undibacterium terreum TaxID=1224302 RepID=A0A916XEX6_9BURK|nr:PAS domain-containing methyl-accepting chemotaxis protein [Undibacterium terreum]GGC66961.1 aerotaxis sensor receptor [Undibacterium terreum]